MGKARIKMSYYYYYYYYLKVKSCIMGWIYDIFSTWHEYSINMT